VLNPLLLFLGNYKCLREIYMCTAATKLYHLTRAMHIRKT